MPIVPMKQTVKVYKKGYSDGWGGTGKKQAPIEYKARVSESTNVEEKIRLGYDEMDYRVKIYFDKYPDITQEDEIEYTDEHGHTYRYQPRLIDVKRNFGGKPLLTVVYVE